LVSPEKAVMPAKAGIQKGPEKLDSRLRGMAKRDPIMKRRDFEIGSNKLFSLQFSD